MPTDTRGRARPDDRRVISSIIHVLKSGGRWIDAPDVYGPGKILCNRIVRWSGNQNPRPERQQRRTNCLSPHRSQCLRTHRRRGSVAIHPGDRLSAWGKGHDNDRIRRTLEARGSP
ncbi:transposase [Roseibium sp.]|uniref:transposase n=1 Tax=Roseibium sp. TaxID=1936156 RepID=UPI003D111DDF